MTTARRRMSRRAARCERRADQISADLSADLDQVNFADLARFWPEGIGGNAREWLVANIPVGIARNGHVDLGLAARPDLSAVELTRASGTLDGEGLQVHWLRPIPPIDNGQAQLRMVDPDTLEITVTGGRQRLRNQKESAATVCKSAAAGCASPASCSRTRSA